MGNACGGRARARASASRRAWTCAGPGGRALGAPGARVILAAALALLAPAAGAFWRAPQAQAQPSYPLYYSFQIPLALPGISIQEGGSRTTYTGTLRGTLGGLPIRSATFTYGPGASAAVGGGTFRLTTAAGEVRDGLILMTSDGGRTNLLFTGIYLGSHLEFTLTSEDPQIGGVGVAAAGLARTEFATHEAYMTAVRKSVDALSPSARDEILAQADTNLRLVSEYEQTPSPP